MKKPELFSKITLKHVNFCLLAIIILANSYVLVSPLLPKLSFEVKKVTKPVKVNPADEDSVKNISRATDHIVVPSLQMDETVYFGDNSSLVHKGVWHRPDTSTPEQGGNTVIVGHRFTYNGPAVFYSLDQLKAGDDIYFVRSGKIYHYQTIGYHIVPPTATEVEEPTSNQQLTLYTCTPLITAKDRLVYVAQFKEVL